MLRGPGLSKARSDSTYGATLTWFQCTEGSCFNVGPGMATSVRQLLSTASILHQIGKKRDACVCRHKERGSYLDSGMPPVNVELEALLKLGSGAIYATTAEPA